VPTGCAIRASSNPTADPSIHLARWLVGLSGRERPEGEKDRAAPGNSLIEAHPIMSNPAPEVWPLLERLQGGDPTALAALFDFYRPRLRQMVRLRMGPATAARFDPSDVLQEAFLDATRQVDGYLKLQQVPVYVWLRGLTWERLLKLRRQHLGAGCRSALRELTLPDDSQAGLADRLLDPGASPGHTLLRQELCQRVRDALTRLDPDDAEVILMRHFEGLSNREVALTLGLSDAGASLRYGRALLRLKALLTADPLTGGSSP
jgi:RNA polymerase sigma-70 factor (ECF subfamily)